MSTPRRLNDLGKPARSADPGLALVQAWLHAHPGCAIGENHHAPEAPAFITRHARELRKLGVTTVFVEGVDHRDQDLLDHFSATGNITKEFPPRQGTRFNRTLDWSLNRWNQMGRDGLKDIYLQMYRTLRRAGIKLIAIDDEDSGGPRRLQRSNPVWVSAVQKHRAQLKPGEKYLVHGGYFHFCDLHNETNAGPRVNASLGIPALFINTPEKGQHTGLRTQRTPAEHEAKLVVKAGTYTAPRHARQASAKPD